MSIQSRKRKDGRIVHYITFGYNGSTVWELAGTDRRAAESLERRRVAEVADGTYSPEVKGAVTVARWFDYFWTVRKNRAAEYDRRAVELHVLSQDAFARLPLHEVRPLHIMRMVEAIRKVGAIGEKTLANTYGVVRQAFARAVFEERIATNPCTLPKGTIRWKSSRKNARKPYTRAEAHALCFDARIPIDQRMWNALAFFSGGRMGEVCGRRWRDWIREAHPLTALSIHSQYEDQPLKTDDEEDTHPRMVPVHPELEALLWEWWEHGWEFVYRRPPTLEDWIVPNRLGTCRAKYTAWESFQRGLNAVEIENRTVHATRHTFVSVARSRGARPDVLERVTHNASGAVPELAVLDGYTHFEWEALCEAVRCFDVSLDPIAESSIIAGGPTRVRSWQVPRDSRATAVKHGKSEYTKNPEILTDPRVGGAAFDARQKEDAASGDVLRRGLAAALRGDVASAVDLLAGEARRVVG